MDYKNNMSVHKKNLKEKISLSDKMKKNLQKFTVKEMNLHTNEIPYPESDFDSIQNDIDGFVNHEDNPENINKKNFETKEGKQKKNYFFF
jgi:hypothetical protein